MTFLLLTTVFSILFLFITNVFFSRDKKSDLIPLILYPFLLLGATRVLVESPLSIDLSAVSVVLVVFLMNISIYYKVERNKTRALLGFSNTVLVLSLFSLNKTLISFSHIHSFLVIMSFFGALSLWSMKELFATLSLFSIVQASFLLFPESSYLKPVLFYLSAIFIIFIFPSSIQILIGKERKLKNFEVFGISILFLFLNTNTYVLNQVAKDVLVFNKGLFNIFFFTSVVLISASSFFFLRFSMSGDSLKRKWILSLAIVNFSLWLLPSPLFFYLSQVVSVGSILFVILEDFALERFSEEQFVIWNSFFSCSIVILFLYSLAESSFTTAPLHYFAGVITVLFILENRKKMVSDEALVGN